MNLYGWFKRFAIGVSLSSVIVGSFLMLSLKSDYKLEHGVKYYSTSAINPIKSGCKIPITPIWPEFMKKDWKIRKRPDCSQRRILAQLNDTDQMLRVLEKYSKLHCCQSEVTRTPNRDNTFKLSNCTKIMDRIVNVSEMEFLVIRCKRNLISHVNYFANIPMKPKVQSKIDVWKKSTKKSNELPLSVLVLGIDATSRSHAYRSIPKTMGLMKTMGFYDFQGYHSVAPSTLPNYMGFLMGLTVQSVRGHCAPNWISQFDSCPFIWKNFSRHHYATMYSEDGAGTFNWGGQSGFRSQPTDYYPHPLFLANDKSCTSSETVPQFLLHYTQRFVHKFKDIPFFSFTWLENPFHDDPYTLGNIENDTLKFFKSLQALPGFLERTLVVFLADHGVRMDYSDSKSGVEAFIERGLPPLLIRFPELLFQRHPELELDSILEHNLNSLLTPFDLHHTLLHILTLDGRNDSEFEPVRNDRQSLLTRIESESGHRDCETLNINPESCVCNVNVSSSEDQLTHNQYLRDMLMRKLKNELNQIVASSQYSSVCAKWAMLPEWVSSIRILDKTANYTDLHVQFSADQSRSTNDSDSNSGHGIAKFEAKIRVGHSHKHTYERIKTLNKLNLIGKISRVSLYGNQSWCVRFETDQDKEMKEFCLCKPAESLNKKI